MPPNPTHAHTPTHKTHTRKGSSLYDLIFSQRLTFRIFNVSQLQVLAPDLLALLHQEFEESRRRPQTLTLKWRRRGEGWSRTSASCPMPLAALVQPANTQQVRKL